MTAVRIRLLGAVTLGLLVFLFRFNTLSGVLGGFDNDHFINLARANQLFLGDWPLRDYPDGSLQGAWPPLAYLAPAGAQMVFGHSLRAEGVLTAAGVAAGTVLTVLAAANITSSTWLGLAAALFSVLPSIKLYGYARPMLFGVGMLLIFRCVDRPTLPRSAALAAAIAVAFLFRHDYGVYLAIGWIAASAARMRREPRPALVQLCLTGAMTVALLLPTFVSVQRLVGIGSYIATARALSQDEFNRTNLQWPTFATAEWWSAANAIPWLYYLYLALPFVAAAVALTRAYRGTAPDGETGKVLAVAAAAFVANRFLLRGNVEARLADTAVFIVIAGVWLVKVAFEPVRTPGRRGLTLSVAARAAAAAMLFVSVVALGTVGAVRREFDTAKLSESPTKTLERTALVWSRLGEQPPVTWPPDQQADNTLGETLDGAMLAAAYVNTCTTPDDRLLVATSAPEVVAFARRGFAAGHVDFIVGFYSTPAEQAVAVARAERQSIPIVLTEPADTHGRVFATEFPIVEQFLRDRYQPAGQITHNGEPYLQVLTRRNLTPAGQFRSTGLPCFR